MRPRILRVLALPLILGIAACSTPAAVSTPPAGSTAAPGASAASGKVSAADVGANLMTALRDGAWADAYAILSTGQARSFAADPAALQSTIESGGLTPTSWTFEPLQYDVDDSGNDLLVGTVTFADGSSGTAKITFTALGTSDNPWRVQDFELHKG